MSISRRKFLGWIGAAGSAAAVSGSAYGAKKHFKGYPESYGVLHDTVKCIGCRSCEEGCNIVNKLPKPEKSFDDLSVLDEKRRRSSFYYKRKKPLYQEPTDIKNKFNPVIHRLAPFCLRRPLPGETAFSLRLSALCFPSRERGLHLRPF